MRGTYSGPDVMYDSPKHLHRVFLLATDAPESTDLASNHPSVARSLTHDRENEKFEPSDRTSHHLWLNRRLSKRQWKSLLEEAASLGP